MKEYLVIGDLHCGSRYGITNDPQNGVQKALRVIWDGMLKELKHHKLEGGINLGDNCEGVDRHGNGEYNDTNNVLEQVNLASELLKEIPVKKWSVVQGSPYHTAQNVSSDALVARFIDGEFNEECVINAGKKRIHCSHMVGVSMAGTAYRTTPIAREMMLATINASEYGKFDCILRGHAHYFVLVRFGGSMGVINPCWKGRDAFAARRTLAMMPHIGYSILKVTDDEDIILEPHVASLTFDNLITEIKF